VYKGVVSVHCSWIYVQNGADDWCHRPLWINRCAIIHTEP